MVSRSLKVIGTFAVSLAASSSALSVGSQPSALHARPVAGGASRPSGRSRPAFVGRHATAAAASVVSIELGPNPYAAASSRDVPTMMPATLDRPAVKTGGPAVLDRPETAPARKRSAEAERAPAKERKSVGSEAWEVRIYNDGVNTREFVARCLVQVAGLSEMAAYQTMMQAHHNGLAVVGRYPYERAEMYHEALKTNGILCDLVEVDSE
jgi:ATP-dependent Clp protease adaptor protein ClpS